MAHSCARAVAGRLVPPSLLVHPQPGPASGRPSVAVLRPRLPLRKSNAEYRWNCSLHQHASEAACEERHLGSGSVGGHLQAKEQSGAAACPLWLQAVPFAVIGACCLGVGAAHAGMAPEDCAALLPAEEALDKTFGIEADSNTVVFVASILEAVALIGAVVGGVIARNRKEETDRLNQQLRQINLQLRKQARVESYAPGLSYAPISVASGRALVAEPAPVNGVSHEQAEQLKRLKTGKKWLREQRPALALEEFKIALALARQAQDAVSEKKAARGLGASCQRLGRYKEAIGYHEIVLKTSERAGDTSGDSEAYGAIADCYTELGDLEKAGKYYDQYISRLQITESVDLDN